MVLSFGAGKVVRDQILEVAFMAPLFLVYGCLTTRICEDEISIRAFSALAFSFGSLSFIWCSRICCLRVSYFCLALGMCCENVAWFGLGLGIPLAMALPCWGVCLLGFFWLVGTVFPQDFLFPTIALLSCFVLIVHLLSYSALLEPANTSACPGTSSLVYYGLCFALVEKTVITNFFFCISSLIFVAFFSFLCNPPKKLLAPCLLFGHSVALFAVLSTLFKKTDTVSVGISLGIGKILALCPVNAELLSLAMCLYTLFQEYSKRVVPLKANRPILAEYIDYGTFAV